MKTVVIASLEMSASGEKGIQAIEHRSDVDRLIEIKECWLNSSETLKAKEVISWDLFLTPPLLWPS